MLRPEKKRAVLRCDALASAAKGWMAEWLCSGLQLRLRRFDSDSSLHYFIRYRKVNYSDSEYRSVVSMCCHDHFRWRLDPETWSSVRGTINLNRAVMFLVWEFMNE